MVSTTPCPGENSQALTKSPCPGEDNQGTHSPAQVRTVRVSTPSGPSAPSQNAVISPDGVAAVTNKQADFNNLISKH